MEHGRVGGRYRVERVAGSGGMATVYRATDLTDGRPVAIKRILDRLRDDPYARELFVDEVRVTRALAHPRLVSLRDHGDDDQGPWMALRWVEGLDARRLVALRKVPLPAGAVLAMAVDALGALRSIHGAGVIHRDVAPANVLLGIDGTAWIADLGLARSLAHARAEAPGTVKGKIGYLAPEVLRGGLHGVRADLYGFGAVLWECLAGRRLFADVMGQTALARAFLESPRPLLRTVNPDVPDALARVVDATLSLDPDARPPTAAALSDALVRAAQRAGVTPSHDELAVVAWGAATLHPEGPRSIEARRRSRLSRARTLHDRSGQRAAV